MSWFGRDYGDDLLSCSAAFLAVGALAWIVGDGRTAAWVGAAGATLALMAVFWRDSR